MKTLIGAIALVLAVPAAAQTAPAADHSAHKGMDHSQHKSGKHDCMECCEKMKGKDGKMECMDKKGEASTSASGAQQDHLDHSAHAQ